MIKNYIPLCKAIVTLMTPLVEVVIHDIKSGTIYAKYGNLSKRNPGDPSLIDNEGLQEQINEVVYPKLNFDGRIIKSISVPINDGNNIIALICINCDVSIFNQIKNIANEFLAVKEKQPVEIFKNDWQERLHVAVNQIIQEEKYEYNTLTNPQKKYLVRKLFTAGAFSEKNAANYVASILKIGRATIFNYLRELKNAN